MHRLWRLLPRDARRTLVTRLTAALAPRPPRTAPPASDGLVICGELSRASGVGEAARLMLHALPTIGVRAWPLEGGFGARDLPALFGGLPPPGAPLVMHVNSPLLPAALLRLPSGLVRRRMVIGYWAWELPSVPDAWQAGLGFVHEVWVPSRFTRDALAPLLPDRHVRVVPHPVAVSPPRPTALDRASFGLPDDAVVVLLSFNLASSFERKNPLGAIAAFRAAFGARRDRVLVVKLGNPHHFPADLAKILAATGDAANIRLETRILPGGDAHALTRCADIVLSLHRSEGFGLVPAEAMLLGKPVIATNWSGNTDFMTADTAALVGYRLIPAVDPRGVFEAPGAVWADPDCAEAAAHLVRLADDAEARQALGARARAGARRLLGAGALAEAVAGIGLPTGPVT